MANLFLDEIKKQASCFLHEKYKTARLVFTDVTQAELLAEEATNDEPCSPDARTMTKIAEASYDIDDYWRIVDVLHRRFYDTDWKNWRQSYKALVLLEFLLTHGPEDFAEEFVCNADVIRELGSFEFMDEKGFDWGLSMQKKAERIIQLLKGGDTLKQARLKALKITNEIQGFGNTIYSPSASSSYSSASDSSRASSFGSYNYSNSPYSEGGRLQKIEVLSPPEKQTIEDYPRRRTRDVKNGAYTNGKVDDSERVHLWDCPTIEENGCLVNGVDEDDEDGYYEKSSGFFSGIRAKLVSISPTKANGDQKVAFRSLSDVGRSKEKVLGRQFSFGN